MNFEKLFYQVHADNMRMYNREPTTSVAYFGPQAWMELMRSDAARHMGLSGKYTLISFRLLKDRRSSEPEMIRFFVDGVHTHTLNAETGQITALKPKEDEDTVWKLAALYQHLGARGIINKGSCAPYLRVQRPVSPRAVLGAEDFPDRVNYCVISFDEMVDAGLLREDDRSFSFTHKGRTACRAALHYAAAYYAQTKSEFMAIERSLLGDAP